MFFASDNGAPAAPEVIAALAAANQGPAPAYGADPWTRAVERRLAALFEREVTAFLVTTGTAANALALASLCPPWSAAIGHAEAHALMDECGAPEFYTLGAKLVGLPGAGGKIASADLEALLKKPVWGAPRNVTPTAVTITQASEVGTLYRPEEVGAIAEVAHGAGAAVHMDGARFANAVARLGCVPAEITWKAGVDVLSFGFSKNGAIAAEAVVFFDPARAAGMVERRKRGGHLWSKGRYLAAQIGALLEDDLWLALAGHANAMADRLAAGFRAKGIELGFPAEANEVFPVLPDAADAALRAAGAVYHPWHSDDAALPVIADGAGLCRFVCSFATTAAEVDRLLAAVPAQA